MQITSFELQFTFSTLISDLIVNNATIIFHKIPNETFSLNLKSRHIFDFENQNFNSKGSGTGNDKSFATLYLRDACITAFWRQKISLHSNSLVNTADSVNDKGDSRVGPVLPYEINTGTSTLRI